LVRLSRRNELTCDIGTQVVNPLLASSDEDQQHDPKPFLNE